MSAVTSPVKVSVSEYLATSYRPDCEYIDGEVRERNFGEYDHSRMQMLIARYLSNREAQWGIEVLPEQRVQVKRNRYRVPDISVLKIAADRTPILHEPPFLCVEILSREDSMLDVQDRIDDYLAFGVPNVWAVDPRKLRGYYCTAEGIQEAKDGVLRTSNPDIEVPLRGLDRV
jgi:Uma2 family endonuclease